jgi:hypothetical protein
LISFFFNGEQMTRPSGWALLGNCCKQRIPSDFVRITSQRQTSRLAPAAQRIAAVGEVWERSLGIPRMIAAARPALLSYWLPSGTASMRTGCLRLRLQNLLTVLRSRNRGLSLPRTSQARALLRPLCGLEKRPQAVQTEFHAAFAKVSHDMNPIHLEESARGNSRFQRIAFPGRPAAARRRICFRRLHVPS